MPTSSTTTRRTPSTATPTRNNRRGEHPRPAPATAETAASPPTARPPALDTRLTEQQAAQLWAMTPQQRIKAMYEGRLTLGQLTAWSRRRSAEVPTINGELAYIAMYDPEICEAPEREMER